MRASREVRARIALPALRGMRTSRWAMERKSSRRDTGRTRLQLVALTNAESAATGSLKAQASPLWATQWERRSLRQSNPKAMRKKETPIPAAQATSECLASIEIQAHPAWRARAASRTSHRPGETSAESQDSRPFRHLENKETIPARRSRLPMKPELLRHRPRSVAPSAETKAWRPRWEKKTSPPATGMLDRTLAWAL